MTTTPEPTYFVRHPDETYTEADALNNTDLRAKNIELTRLPTQSEMAELVALRARNAELLRAAKIALGSLTGGMDGDWIGDDPITVLSDAIAKGDKT